jgi:hypothetical protein
MANRIFVCAVVALWLGSMSWLAVDKVLPSFHEGEPPLAAGFEPGVPVAWEVTWGSKPVGHAASLRTAGVLNTTNIHSRIVLKDVPLLDLVPALMREVVGDIGNMTFDAHTRLEFDSLDNFSRFHSVVSINHVPSILDLIGEMHGSFLELKVTFGDMVYTPKVPISDRGALSEALFPDSKLPYMYVGRRWHEEVYNPFRSPSSPVETIDAEVTGIESIEFGEKTERVMRVEFRGPPGPGIPEDARLQAEAWVRAKDGLVLRQDVHLANSRLRFERLPQKEADKIGASLFDNGRSIWGDRDHEHRGRPHGKHRRADREGAGERSEGARREN